MLRWFKRVAAVFGASVCLLATSAWGAEPVAAAPSGPAAATASKPETAPAAGPAIVVLDTVGGIWRTYCTLKPPVIQQAGGGVKPFLTKIRWLDWETPPPSPDWTMPEMDDHYWMHGAVNRFPRTPYLARLNVRGKFEVTDPARVKGLALSLDYYGGAVVYVNGKELSRDHVAAGADVGQAQADPYPLEAFVVEDGSLLYETPNVNYGQTGADPSRVRLRLRNLKVSVPQELLRKGVNVIAVDIVRAPYHQIVEEKKDKTYGLILSWNTCELRRAQLVAGSVEGLVPNATRPAGLQVWNADTLAGGLDADFGDRTEPLRPIALSGARNALVTGKVLVGRDKPIRELKVTASDLRSSDGVIPAAQAFFWYGEAVLAQVPPKEYRVPTELAREPLVSSQAKPVFAAVAPIWVRVKVPKSAKPGTYAGTVTIQMADEPPVSVPVEVKVLAWTMPDPQDFKTWVELVQSPDTLAVEYNVPLWSQEHFALIAKSFDLLNDTGMRIVYVPAIAHTNHGNAESMIRWIKKGEGKYEWDFSAMDRYLDVALKHLGTPKLVCLQVWEVYMGSKESTGRRFGEVLAEQQKVSGGAPLVTVLDPATGKTENVTLPKLSDPVSKPIWQELMKQVREHLRKRGLESALILGMFTDSTPTKEDTRFFLDIAPDLGWVQQGHNIFKNLNGMVEVKYTANWWSPRFADDSASPRSDVRDGGGVATSMFGWKNQRLDALYERSGGLDTYPPTRWRFECETAITTDIMRGIGRLGADFWKPIKNKEGRRAAFVHNRFPDGEWIGTGHDISSWMLEPLPDGPAATNRLVALEDGVQECEARIFIEQALTDEGLKAKLGADLVRRCQETLDERLMYVFKSLGSMQLELHGWGVGNWRFSAGPPGHAWFLSTGWPQRTEKLYALAAEVAQKTGQQ